MTSEAARRQFGLFDTIEPGVADLQSAMPPPGKFSNFVVHVDESGDHGMQTLDPHYPLFVLAFCVFYKRHYAEKVSPALEKFKFNHFGHDLVVLHETEIRKETGVFRFHNRDAKQRFMGELTDIIEESNFILISCVIDKQRLRVRGGLPENPYHLALGFCLETLHELMQEKTRMAPSRTWSWSVEARKRMASWNWSSVASVTAPTDWASPCPSTWCLPASR